MSIQDLLGQKLIMFDGAMGTMLHRAGLKTGEIPEAYNLTHPEVIKEIHESYVKAGADVITTNTFQANEFKLKHGNLVVEEVIQAGINLARSAGAKYVALDIGPSGQMLEPLGALSFDQAYELFARQIKAGVAAGADLILFETFSDLLEAKAAILAAKQNCQLPVICTMTFEKNRVTLIGNDPVTATITLQSLGVDALGVNCSLGPKELVPIIEAMLQYAQVPVIAQPNAGLPKFDGKNTYYDISPEEFANSVVTMVEKGVAIVGGCCGTTPEHIVAVKAALGEANLVKIAPEPQTTASSGRSSIVIGERSGLLGGTINLANQEFTEMLKPGKLSGIVGEAKKQQKAGAQVLQIKVGSLESTEQNSLVNLIKRLQRTIALPLIISSAKPEDLAAGVRSYTGKPIISWTSDQSKDLSTILAIAKTYGACFLARLWSSSEGVKAQPELTSVEEIIRIAEAHEIARQDILISYELPPEMMHPEEVNKGLEVLAKAKEQLAVKTVLELGPAFFSVANGATDNLLAKANAQSLDLIIIEALSPAEAAKVNLR